MDLIKVEKDLHNIKQIIILDHKDCGAFKISYGSIYNSQRMKKLHIKIK